MKIFLGWSGKSSKAVADVLYKWLPKMFSEGVTVWMSSQDIEAGQLWENELDAQLSSENFGILCLVPRNRSKAWLLFEAGALSKSVASPRVVPYCLGFGPGKIPEPLSRFQGVPADRDGTWKLVKSINKQLRMKSKRSASDLRKHFEKKWTELDNRLNPIKHKIRIRRGVVPCGIFIGLFLVLAICWRLQKTSVFPDFEPARESLNTANAAPLLIEYHSCDSPSENNCPRGYYYSFDAASSGGYATLVLSRYVPINLLGRQILVKVRFRRGKRLLEIGLTDDIGNRAFFDCRSDSADAVFSVPLNPRELLESGCRFNLASVKHFSIGYASSAGVGNHGFDLYDLSFVSEDSVSTSGQCKLRRCFE
jgi:hypothetical protein